MRDSAEQALNRLTERYGIKWKEDDNTGLYVLNYDQIDSSKHKFNQIVRECRSLVLATESIGDMNEPQFYVVSRSFDRFFNYSEEFGNEYDLTKLIAHEKMDGSLVSLFYVEGEGWLYRTKSMIMPAEDMKINGFDTSWKEIIEEALMYNKLLDYTLDERDTYIFEICSPENRVVTRYEGRTATLLAIRVNETGQYQSSEWCDEMACVNGWQRPRTWEFNNWEEVLQGAKDLPNLEEGYVMYHDEFNLPVMKCKNPAYVAAHHLRGEGLNPKRCMDLVIINETDEYLTVFPEDVNILQPYITAYEMLEFTTNYLYDDWKFIREQKEFALAVKDYPQQGIFFTMRKQGLTFKQAFDKLTSNAKYKLIQSFL